ncbi:MAG TPA: non-canonical purine NTP pyrophosphatase [Patescibacteria group bacterium]|nr:non-canonical purine NTP pyrophosphatase [Patescibacteria group bacterium]
MSQIVIASTNPHKIGKIKAILEPYFDDIKSLVDFPDITPVEEDGTTFAENAKKKALGLSKELHTTVIATDAGATIPALGDKWNALYTRRFIGENKTDEDRVKKMLEMMKDENDRRIWFTEAYTFCKDGEVLFETQVDSPVGRIKESWDGRMKPGAWLLSLWHLPNRQKDFFDLTPKEIEAEENTWAALKQKIDSYFTSRQL